MDSQEQTMETRLKNLSGRISFSRNVTPMNVLLDGEVVGRIVRLQRSGRHYGVFIAGVRYRRGEITTSGKVGTSTTTLKDAKELAKIAVQWREENNVY